MIASENQRSQQESSGKAPAARLVVERNLSSDADEQNAPMSSSALQ